LKEMGVKARIRCMRDLKSFASAERFCRSYDTAGEMRWTGVAER